MKFWSCRMNLNSPIFVAILLFVFVYQSDCRIFTEIPDKFEKLRIKPKTMEKMQNLHKNSYYTAIKAVIGKLGKDLYKKLPNNQKRLLARCLDNVDDKRDLTTSAKCVVQARKYFLKWEQQEAEMYKVASTTRRPQHWKSFLQQFDDVNVFHEDLNASNASIVAVATTPAGILTDGRISRTKTIEMNGYGASKEEKSQFFPRKLLFSRRSKLYSLYSGDLTNNQLFRPQNRSISVNLTPKKQLKQVKIKMLQPKTTTTAPVPAPAPIKPATSRFHSLSSQLASRYPKYFNYRLPQVLPYSAYMAKPSTPKSKKSSTRLSKYRFRSKRQVVRFRDSKEHYFKTQKFDVKKKDSLQSLSVKDDKSIVSNFANVINTFVEEATEKVDMSGKDKTWSETYERLAKVRKESDDRKKVPGAKSYEHRMYDLVLDRDEPSLSPKERKSPQGIVHEAMHLITKMTQNDATKNTTQVPGHRIFSPRFMPLMPVDDGKKVQRTFSPDIMSLYDDPNSASGKMTSDHVGSVPSLLKTLGLTPKDRDKIMKTVMDITGSSGHIDDALKIYEYLGMFDKDVSGPILDATEKLMSRFKKLEHDLQLPQKLGYEERGFTWIKKEQVQTLMRDEAMEEDEVDLSMFDIYDKMTDEEMEEALWQVVENIGNNITVTSQEIKDNHNRKKRTLPVIVGQPLILAPFMFTLQYGFSVLGPLILSPNIFSPPILNPSVLSPWILTPAVADPFILSPYIFGPFILGPFVLTPFILTPYLLSPNVLNPYVLTSLVLSPIGLSPDILSPMVLSGSVLSPSFLSPAVLTPTYLTGSVLSPSFLS